MMHHHKRRMAALEHAAVNGRGDPGDIPVRVVILSEDSGPILATTPPTQTLRRVDYRKGLWMIAPLGSDDAADTE